MQENSVTNIHYSNHFVLRSSLDPGINYGIKIIKNILGALFQFCSFVCESKEYKEPLKLLGEYYTKFSYVNTSSDIKAPPLENAVRGLFKFVMVNDSLYTKHKTPISFS